MNHRPRPQLQVDVLHQEKSIKKRSNLMGGFRFDQLIIRFEGADSLDRTILIGTGIAAQIGPIHVIDEDRSQANELRS